VEIYYFTRKLKNCQNTGSTAPKKIQVYKWPPASKYLLRLKFSIVCITTANYEWILHFLMVEINFFTSIKKSAVKSVKLYISFPPHRTWFNHFLVIHFSSFYHYMCWNFDFVGCLLGNNILLVILRSVWNLVSRSRIWISFRVLEFHLFVRLWLRVWLLLQPFFYTLYKNPTPTLDAFKIPTLE